MNPSSHIDRRRFLKLSSASAITAAFVPSRLPGIEDHAAIYARVIPGRKNLDPAWLASLITKDHPLDAGIRGTKSKSDLSKIGMTVGGIGCGTVYLCGDGRLFIWDIFNQPHEGVVAQHVPIPEGLANIQGGGKTVRERDGSNYLNPPNPDSFPNPFRQYFELRVADQTRKLQSSDWSEVTFDGKWPLGEVTYSDPACPINVQLKAWTPFIPLDLKRSSLPVTVMEYTLHNTSDASQEATISGILENPCLLHTRKNRKISTSTRLHRSGKLTLLSHSATSDPSDQSNGPDVEQAGDFGTMVLALLDLDADSDKQETLSTKIQLPPGEKRTITFLLCWHFPNLSPLPGIGPKKNHCFASYTSAEDATIRISRDFASLREDTMKWVDTWYQSSLPRWVLDRAAATTNTLQTSNCLIFDDGRFWAWEGIGCCPGTCGHVWHYAQGPARLFPEIERNLRLVTDFGVAQNPDGAIRFRAEAANNIAIDSQTGTVLRTWREHLCSVDGDFLKKAWPGVKKATHWLLEFDRKDPGGLDGLLHGEQHNTLDAEWYGKVHALCSLYLASLRAAAEMAIIMDDADFADNCRQAFESGYEKISILFNGEFYVQEEDPKHPNAIGVGTGCYIDQVIGQWWAHQTGLGRISPEDHVKSALNSLWKYNFVPDVGPFRTEFKQGRFYAMPGEAGLVMCTWPKGGLKPDFMKHWQYAYFNECMSGFEWQAAAHMIQEGEALTSKDDPTLIEDPENPKSLTLRGLAIARAIHDRYSPNRRNPYNEIECSDHYARAAAGYSMLLALSGFHYDGPRGAITFDPKLEPTAFTCPFTAAEGWGTYSQKLTDDQWSAELTLAHGSLRLSAIHLPWLTSEASATLNGTTLTIEPNPGMIIFPRDEIRIHAGSTLQLTASNTDTSSE